MGLTVETGSDATGKYVRFYDPDLGAGTSGDLLVIQHGLESPSSSAEVITLPYTLADATYKCDLTTNTNAVVGECHNVAGKTASSFTAYGRRIKPGITAVTRDFNWACYWIRSGTHTYDELECGSAGTGYYAKFIDSGATVRIIQCGSKSNSVSNPSITLPVTHDNANYYAGGACHSTTQYIEIGKQPSSTASTLNFIQAGQAFGNFDWVTNWIST